MRGSEPVREGMRQRMTYRVDTHLYIFLQCGSFSLIILSKYLFLTSLILKSRVSISPISYCTPSIHIIHGNYFCRDLQDISTGDEVFLTVSNLELQDGIDAEGSEGQRGHNLTNNNVTYAGISKQQSFRVNSLPG